MNQAIKTELSALRGAKNYQSPQMTVVPIRASGAMMLVGSAAIQGFDPKRSDLDIEDGYNNVATKYTEETSDGWNNFFGSSD